MNDSRNDAANLIFLFLAGAIVGVGVGILIAPKSGRETRRQIADLAHRAQEKAADLASRIRQRSDGADEELKGRLAGA